MMSAIQPHRLTQVRIPALGFCEQKLRLRDNFVKAVQKMNALLSEQMQAVIAGDAEFSRFDLLLHVAQSEKEQAKYAWMLHVESHGCGEA